MFIDLRQFLEALRKENELIIINAPVDPHLELAEIHRRVIAEQGPALLFTNVKGSPFSVVTNLFGTAKRVNLAFGTRPEQLANELVGLIDTLMPPTAQGLWQARKPVSEVFKVGLKRVSRGNTPVLQEKQTQVDLHQIPAITSWPEDGGPFVTLPLVYTESPETGTHNLGMYRLQIYDQHTTGMHWQINKGGGFHYYEAEQQNQSLPSHVFIGGPPALIASSIAPVPEFVPELLLTSFIIGKKLPVYQENEGSYPIVANAEFALLGEVPPFERRPEGPFGDHYGYYSLQHDFPIYRVHSVYHRKDAIYPATIVGKPKQEDYYLGEFLQRLLSPAFPMVMPGIKQLWTYAETGFHPLAAAIVRESYQREIFSHAFRILGEGQLKLTKFLILTDQSVPLDQFSCLLETVLERFDPSTDLLVIPNTSMDTLDYTGHRLNHGSKAVLMGVGEPKRNLPSSYENEPIPNTEIKVYGKGTLVIQAPTFEQRPDFATELLAHYKDRFREWPLVILVDEIQSAENQTSFLWTLFTRFDPAQDIYASYEAQHHHFHYQLPIIIDARMKPGYPQELQTDEATSQQVNKRWKEYFTE